MWGGDGRWCVIVCLGCRELGHAVRKLGVWSWELEAWLSGCVLTVADGGKDAGSAVAEEGVGWRTGSWQCVWARGGGEARVAEELGDVLAHGGGGHGEMEEKGDLGGWGEGAEWEKLALGEERVKVGLEVKQERLREKVESRDMECMEMERSVNVSRGRERRRGIG